MPSPDLDRLVTSGLLEREPPIRSEFEALLREAGTLLRDAHNKNLSLESRFHLAYSAAHSIAREDLAAVIAGYSVARLKAIFPGVAEQPAVLTKSKGSSLHLFCFAAASGKGAPIALRMAKHLL